MSGWEGEVREDLVERITRIDYWGARSIEASRATASRIVRMLEDEGYLVDPALLSIRPASAGTHDGPGVMDLKALPGSMKFDPEALRASFRKAGEMLARSVENLRASHARFQDRPDVRERQSKRRYEQAVTREREKGLAFVKEYAALTVRLTPWWREEI